MRVEFSTPIPNDARATVCDALSEACFGRFGPLTAKKRESKACFEGDELRIESPKLETSFMQQSNDGDSKTVHHNRFLHLWLRRCVDKGLLVVHSSYPIAKLDVSIR